MQPEVETRPLAAGHPQSGKRKFLRDLSDKDADKINGGGDKTEYDYLSPRRSPR